MTDVFVAIIWVIEDHALCARAHAQSLARISARLSVRLFATTAAATEALHSGPRPDGIILDEKVGRDSGLAWLEVHHDELKGAEVLLVTGHLDNARSARAYALGACSIMKPIERYQLEPFVHNVEGVALQRVAGPVAPDPYAEAVARQAEEWDLAPMHTEIVYLEVTGLTPAEVIAKLGFKPSTYASHVHKILRRARLPSMHAVIQTIHRRRR